MTEVWKDIKSYEGFYQINSTGSVKSLERLDSVGRPLKERILKTCIDGAGYSMVRLWRSSKEHKFKIHRLVASHFISNPNNKPQINHIDGNKTNNKPENLEWCNSSENLIHAYETGLHKSKVTKEEIETIKKLKGRGFSQTDIGEMFNICQTQVSRIQNNKCWVNY